MIMRIRFFIIAAILLSLSQAFAASETVMVPMRDGTKLATDVYLPTDHEPPFPAVLIRTVYGRKSMEKQAESFTALGLAAISQDTRGRGDSEGEDSAFVDDGWGVNQDGADTVDWIKKQKWCDGNVGTWGMSALGVTQVLMAPVTPSLKCQAVIMAPSNFYGQLSYQGGVFRKDLCDNWLKVQGIIHVLDVWHSHPAYDAFWEQFNVEPKAGAVTAPTVFMGGWFDFVNQGIMRNFMMRQHQGGPGAQGNQKLIVGPWPHGYAQNVGELTFPENWGFDFHGYIARFYRHWLQGQQNGIMSEPAVNYYTMGDCDDPTAPGNEWRTADDWPPFPTEETPYYLTKDGKLITKWNRKARGVRSFAYDPADPCPTHGGPNFAIPGGSFDQRQVSTRPDVLRFETPLLDEPVEITGAVKVRLFVSSDAPDTDFTAKLVDIYPDGREMLMLDGIQRVKLRENRIEPLPPGEVAQLEIDLWYTSLVFNKGHKIGVQISSSNFPRFEINPNTGEDFARYIEDPESHKQVIDKDSVRVANNTVYMSKKYPSAVILPIRPKE